MSETTSTAAAPRSWLLTIVASGAALAYAYFVFLPFQKSIAEIRNRLRDKQTFVLQSDLLSDQIHSLTEQLDQTRQFNADWAASAPDERQIPAFYGSISDRAKEAGAQTVRFDPQPIVKLDTVWEVPVTMGCHGSFTQIFQLLRKLEELPSTVWIEELKIESKGKDREDLECEMNVAIFAVNREISD